MHINFIVAACAVVVLCQDYPALAASDILAEIGDEDVTVDELRAFTRAVEDDSKSGESGEKLDSLMLESLIDKKLLLKEAEIVGIADEPVILAKMAEFHRQKILTEYKRHAINRQIEVSEEELEEQQKLGGRNRALRIAGILQETEEEARTTREEILAGADFGEMARKRSLYKETKDQGGVVPQYMRYDDTSQFLRTIFELEVGQITEPMRFQYGKRWRYTIIKVVDEIPVPLYEVRDLVAEEVYGRKRAARAKELADSLRNVYDPQIDMDAVQTVMQQRGSFDADFETLRQLPLCTYRGGDITLEEFLQFVPEGKRSSERLDTPEAFVQFLSAGVVPQELFIVEAVTAGVDQNKKILAALELYRQDQLMQELRLRNVDRLVTVSDQEGRAFYDKHPEIFHTEEQVEVTEILVGIPEEGEWIRQQLDAGEDAKQLAEEHTIREGMAHHHGLITLSRNSRHRTLYEAAEGLEDGAVFGPVKTHSGYSVCKIIGRKMPVLRPYATESKRAAAFVKIRKRKRAFVDYIRTLRQKYGVRVFYDRLAMM